METLNYASNGRGEELPLHHRRRKLFRKGAMNQPKPPAAVLAGRFSGWGDPPARPHLHQVAVLEANGDEDDLPVDPELSVVRVGVVEVGLGFAVAGGPRRTVDAHF